jgi:hypothetical protein
MLIGALRRREPVQSAQAALRRREPVQSAQAALRQRESEQSAQGRKSGDNFDKTLTLGQKFDI